MPAGDFLEFSVSDAGVRAMFERLIRLGTDLTEPMTAIAGHLAATSEDAFEREQDPWTGADWIDLAASTKERRAESGTWPGQKLRVTGHMAASLVAESGRDFASVGVGQDYAPFLQLGTRRMPARPFLGLSDETIDNISDTLQKALRDAADGT